MVRGGLCIFLIHNNRMSAEVHSIVIGKFAFRALGVVLRMVDNSETLRKRKADCAQGAGATKTLGSRRSLARRSAVMVTVSRLQTMRSCKLSTAASDT